MPDPQIAPYGSWSSPITADVVAGGGVRLGEIFVDTEDPYWSPGEVVYWLEGRAAEGGRYVIVRRTPDGEVRDFSPEHINVRTRVHEYGGGSYTVRRGVVYYANWNDQRLYRHDSATLPVPITPEPHLAAGLRYADMRVTPDGSHLVCVRERHPEDGGEAVNELVSLPADGSAEPTVIASGRDFYASPRVSPDGTAIAWLEWDHPNMPWDGTELVTGILGADGTVQKKVPLAGGRDESIVQPEWSPRGILHYISDATGWWNIYAWKDGAPEALAPMEADFAGPSWVFGISYYSFLYRGTIVCSHSEVAGERFGVILPEPDGVRHVQTPYTQTTDIKASGAKVYMIGASPTVAPEIVEFDVEAGTSQVIRKSRDVDIDARYLSAPEEISFPTSDNGTAHAYFYPPRNDDFEAPPGELPPLLVMSHGGPTSAASTSLSLSTQYWTSRGFAVVDVNYRGSTGYGREYRNALRGKWGIYDVDDCIAAARHLFGQDRVDAKRLAITGGSAGGYTTLAALAFHDVFAVGASLYGVADAESLAKDTHKFESRYLDNLIAPYPEGKAIYRERSPIHFVDRISCPLIILQGTEDMIVPQSQADVMAEALDKNGLPYAYLLFEGEQHGFRKIENIVRSLEATLYFFGRVLAFTPADEIEPVEIKNLG